MCFDMSVASTWQGKDCFMREEGQEEKNKQNKTANGQRNYFESEKEERNTLNSDDVWE